LKVADRAPNGIVLESYHSAIEGMASGVDPPTRPIAVSWGWPYADKLVRRIHVKRHRMKAIHILAPARSQRGVESQNAVEPVKVREIPMPSAAQA
jgi:hypothetical protein